ncbi:MAG TPA: UvrD-helicase domain-containing protein [Polyangiaceae bacterium]|nr:UvrD-helicase domain-containing protein [Polyangiaceae bacterium]
MALNSEQMKAVRTLSGPMLVLAGAGSGKTRVVTFRIKELIAHGIKADRILAVTFTNKAAREMRTRATELMKTPRGGARPEISTLHSLCVRILRRHADRLGYPRQFSICDQGDQESFARAALRNVRVDQQKLKPGDFLSLVGGWKSRGLDSNAALEAAPDERQQLAAMAYQRYQEALVARGVFDFDDLLLCTERLLSQFADVRTAEAARFDHVMIDEYQDTNASQYRIIKALTQKHRNLCVVGDDDQSIYGWRGAEVTHILNFARDWPDATIVRLETNYRSKAPILALANTLIANNGTRHSKVLKPFREGGSEPRFIRFEDETAEATAIVREIAQLSGREDEERVPLKDFAILFRTNEQPRAFELEMRREKVRYVLVGGQSFFDRKEVRDILAYLKVLANPADEVSLLRIINTPSRGIGAGTIKSLVDVAVNAGSSLWEVLPQATAELDLPSAMCERIQGFTRLIERYRERVAHERLSQVVRALITEIEYKQELERVYKTPAEVEARFNSVDGVVTSVEEYEARGEDVSLAGFLEETVLGGQDFGDSKEKNQYAVTLMTLHSAKGLEFPHVYMIGMEEGLMPHRRVIAEGNGVEEERRLCYVGVTRAEDTLTLSMCKSRTKWGKARPSIPSRFLLEMRGENDKAARAAEAAEAMVNKDTAVAAAAEAAAAAKANERRARVSKKSSDAAGAGGGAGKPRAAERATRDSKSAAVRPEPSAVRPEPSAVRRERAAGAPAPSARPRNEDGAATTAARPLPAPPPARPRPPASGATAGAPIAPLPRREPAAPTPAMPAQPAQHAAVNALPASRAVSRPSALLPSSPVIPSRPAKSSADAPASGVPASAAASLPPSDAAREATPKRRLPAVPRS